MAIDDEGTLIGGIEEQAMGVGMEAGKRMQFGSLDPAEAELILFAAVDQSEVCYRFRIKKLLEVCRSDFEQFG